MKIDKELKCLYCKEEITLKEILENSKEAWLNQKRISFNCPICKENSYIEMKGKTVSIGMLEGAPGPGFIEYNKIKPSNFSYKVTSQEIIVNFNYKTWHIKAKA